MNLEYFKVNEIDNYKNEIRNEITNIKEEWKLLKMKYIKLI